MSTTATYAQFCQRLHATGVIAIIRMASAEAGADVGARVIDTGLDVIEVSFNTPDAPACISTLARAHPTALVGAGTVVSPAQARAAVQAGARFLLSPGYVPGVAKAADDMGIPYVPGVFTATEVTSCLEAGFDVLKVFPAAPLGPAGMKALLEPFPEARPVPTGGVGPGTAAAWLEAGSLALGVGGSLTRMDDVEAGAMALRASVAEARGLA